MNEKIPAVLRVRDGYLSIVGGCLGDHLKRWADLNNVTPDTPVNIVRHDKLVELLDELRMLRCLGA